MATKTGLSYLIHGVYISESPGTIRARYSISHKLGTCVVYKRIFRVVFAWVFVESLK